MIPEIIAELLAQEAAFLGAEAVVAEVLAEVVEVLEAAAPQVGGRICFYYDRYFSFINWKFQYG